MADRDMVIKSIENCLHEKDCDNCSYEGCIHAHGNCIGDLMAHALELLKEQEAVKPLKSKLSFTHGFDWEIWDCGCCGNQLRSFAKYCDQCGKAVKWDE